MKILKRICYEMRLTSRNNWNNNMNISERNSNMRFKILTHRSQFPQHYSKGPSKAQGIRNQIIL